MAKRPSPDDVICIDLTESDDENKKNISVGRKRRKSAPAAATVKMEGVARAPSAVISIDDDDDDDGGGKIGSCAALQQQEWASEVEVVEPAPPQILAEPSASAAQAASTSDDIVLLGTANESRLPHMRQHCPDHKFVQDIVSLRRQHHISAQKKREIREGKAGNVSFCDLCYCFVCDKPAKECSRWGTAADSSSNSHCHASDSGLDARMWKSRRNAVKARVQPSVARVVQRLPSSVAHASSLAARRARLLASLGHRHAHRHSHSPYPRGSGPFPPDNALAAQSQILTKCRKCGWFNRFDHRNFTHKATHSGGYSWNHRNNPIGHQDWCHGCGRIASERDFGKVQSEAYERTAGDVFLGERVIPFRIVVHDPRKLSKYMAKWASREGSEPNWTYSVVEEEESMFKHRFGEYPRIEVILDSIPVVEPDKISEMVSKDVSPDETEAIILDNPNDRILLEELRKFGTVGGKKRDLLHAAAAPADCMEGDIKARWNSNTQTGTFTVRIFLQSRFFSGTPVNGSPSRLLGAWFNIFPFSLSDLSGLISAEECEIPKQQPWEDSADYRKRKEAFDKVSAEMANRVQEHNDEIKAKSEQLSLNSSTSCDTQGGVSANETGLDGVLRRYYVETFAEDVVGSSGQSRNSYHAWITRGQGFVSRHRKLRAPNSTVDPRKSSYGRLREHNSLGACLSNEDQVLAVSNLAQSCLVVKNKTRSLKGMLDHLENLHHSSVPFVEGLTVDLLEFQRQSVQWALEQETTPGGIQSFLWPKLPTVAEPGHDIYYSPILERFRRDKPKLVRGGIIAEEMGLGKTVISLALILQNPAPAVPQSGSPISALEKLSSNADVASAAAVQTPWDTDLYARSSASNSKRGSILSRGTLVVCHVSLVGQWIDEAKEKLSDPGLVYPYHGQSRKRNAATLAQNAIVVTTYQTLASDATYHANKAGEGYCAPCEQVRWWRIICDESHSLREASTKKSMAIMNLVADHKWLVSGTPVNTSFKDLKNQLKFIGLEHVEEMFTRFTPTALKHAGDPSCTQAVKNSCRDDRVFGHFMFLLRSIMIRHSHGQTYRGTTTTLMSLPPKVERTVEVEFSEEEKDEYGVLDKAARDFYIKFKAEHGQTLSKHYLLLTQKLTPLRIAASGGRIPLEDEEEQKSEEAVDDSDDDEPAAPKKKKARKEKRFSEFAYKSKLNALVRELEQARDEDCKAKSLVFSQFTSTLEWLQRELPKHGFQYRTLSGDMSMKKRAKALHDFQHDPPTTIFLLSMRAGAVGINLTEANRVFLMEPSFNPALEEQAIGRVHRLGQKRNVEIVRFVMKDSVEPRILEMLKKKYADSSTDERDEPADVGGGKKKYVAPALVGSIHSDRTAVLGAEFDILFGVAAQSGLKAEPDAIASVSSL